LDELPTQPPTTISGLAAPLVVHQFEQAPPEPDSKAYLTDEQRKAIADAFYDELQPKLGAIIRVAVKRVEKGKITDLRLLELLLRISWDMTKRGIIPQQNGRAGKSDISWMEGLARIGASKPDESDAGD